MWSRGSTSRNFPRGTQEHSRNWASDTRPATLMGRPAPSRLWLCAVVLCQGACWQLGECVRCQAWLSAAWARCLPAIQPSLPARTCCRSGHEQHNSRQGTSGLTQLKAGTLMQFGGRPSLTMPSKQIEGMVVTTAFQVLQSDSESTSLCLSACLWESLVRDAADA